MASWSSSCTLTLSVTNISTGAFEEPPGFVLGFGVHDASLLIFLSLSLLRGCYCIFSRCVRLSIVSCCDQNIWVDARVNLQVFEAYLTHIKSRQVRWRLSMPSSSSQGFPSSQPSVPPSNPPSSPAQSCSVVHECQLIALSPSSLSPSLPLNPPPVSSSSCLSPSLSSLSVQRKNDCK